MTRHRIGVAIAAAALLAGLIVMNASLIQARRANSAAALAEHQAARAQAVTGFLLDTFRVAEPGRTPGGFKLGVKDAVDIAAKRLDAQFAKQPELAAEFALVLGEVYHELGEFDASIAMLERALRAHVGGAEDGMLADIHSELANAQAGKGDYAAASANIGEAIRLDERIGGHRSARTARDLAISAEIGIGQSDFARAETLLNEALSIARDVPADNGSGVTRILSVRALLLGDMGEPEKARDTMIEVLARTRHEHGEHSLDAAIAMAGLAEADALTNRLAEAIPLQREGVAIQRELFPPNHPFVVAAISSQANFELRAHRYADAERDYRDALDRARRSVGENNPTTVAVLLSLARLRYTVGDFSVAAALDREAIAALTVLGANVDPHAIVVRGDLGMALRELGDYANAETLLRGAHADLRRAFGDSNGFVAANLVQLAVLLRMTGRGAEALALHAQAQSIFDARPKTSPGERGAALTAFAETERMAGRREQGLAHIDEALSLLPRQLPPDDDAIIAAQIVKGRILVDAGRGAEAEPLLRQALDQSVKTWGDQHWRTASARSALGLCLLARGRREEASRWLASAAQTLERTRGKTFPLAVETRAALSRRN